MNNMFAIVLEQYADLRLVAQAQPGHHVDEKQGRDGGDRIAEHRQAIRCEIGERDAVHALSRNCDVTAESIRGYTMKRMTRVRLEAVSSACN